MQDASSSSEPQGLFQKPFQSDNSNSSSETLLQIAAQFELIA